MQRKHRMYSDLFDEVMLEVGDVEYDIYEWDFDTGYGDIDKACKLRIRKWRERLELVYNKFERHCSYGP